MRGPARRQDRLELLPELEHAEHLRALQRRLALGVEEAPAVGARPHVDVLVHEERDAGQREPVVLGRLVELGQVAEPVVPRLPALRVHAGAGQVVAAAAQDLGAPRVRDAPVLAVRVLEPPQHGREDLVLADGLHHVVHRLDEPLGPERGHDVGLGVRRGRRALGRHGRLQLAVHVAPAHALGADLDVLVELLEVLDDRLHRRAGRRIGLGVPHGHHDLLLRPRRPGADRRGRRCARRRAAEPRQELPPAQVSRVPLFDQPPQSWIAIPTCHDGPFARGPLEEGAGPDVVGRGPPDPATRCAGRSPGGTIAKRWSGHKPPDGGVPTYPHAVSRRISWTSSRRMPCSPGVAAGMLNSTSVTRPR